MSWVKVKSELINLANVGSVRLDEATVKGDVKHVVRIMTGATICHSWYFHSTAAAELLFEKLYNAILGSNKVEDICDV